MKQFAKNILALGVTSALSLSTVNYSHAAIYEVVDKGNAENLEYTYGKKQNDQGVMAVAGSNAYNFPVQWEKLTTNDFNQIHNLALRHHETQYGLEPIEDFDALQAGDPTANDLAWSKIFLKERNSSSQNPNFEYQIVADTVAMINLGEGSQTNEIRVFDTAFDGTYSAGAIVTRSTYDVIEGVTGSGISFGVGTAPYLALLPFEDSRGFSHHYWVRDHGQRGFFSRDNGESIIPVIPDEIRYGGGVSALLDMNDNGVAVGYGSYKLSKIREDYILDVTGGCEDPTILANIPKEICVQKVQSGMYYIQAVKATLLDTDEVKKEQLGLLVTPHPDDDRGFTSQALAVNNNGVAVGYAHGWNRDNTDVIAPVLNERMNASYAVMYKDGKVFDFNQPHYNFRSSIFAFSKAHDINDNGLVVGYTSEVNTWIKKFFYVDSSVPDSEMKIVIPDGFFSSSKSTAFAVNAAGVIVGEAEIETHNDSTQNPRRTAGFIYDTASEEPEIIDINNLLECNSLYNIMKASDINDEGMISATAIVKSDSYDAKGELIVDENGKPVRIDVVRAVLLKPIPGGVKDDCSTVEEKVERQGGSFGGVTLLTLFAFFGLRIRRFIR